VTQDRGVIPKSMCDENFMTPNSFEGLKLVEVNDFVISLRSFQGGIEFSNYRGIVSPAYNVIRLKPHLSNLLLLKFYKYFFKSPKHIAQLNTVISGIRDGQNINWNDFKNLTLPFPDEYSIQNMFPEFQAFEDLKTKFTIEVKMIEEYKSSLITDCINGKRKIRNAK
jgi:restriction endonuclease S subunit